MSIDNVLYGKLVELARSRSLATYGDVAPLIGLNMDREEDREDIARRLGEIVLFEHANGRPMLTALVVHKGGDNNPGEGFFSAAEAIGIFSGSRNQLRRLTFWVNQVGLVYNHWSESS
ncbi:hypothetical protein [Stenotrophomonas maltophilia]|uniref:hypothetical protein n=1 Tax=Stenotrophomonas maltophilia TaxID=40324 RepID=UPI0038CAC2D8